MSQVLQPQHKLSRRAVLTGAAAVGGLAIGVDVGGIAHVFAQKGAEAGTHELGAWVVVQPDEGVIIRIARTEMGQGTRTGLAQLVAEELECDWKYVQTEMPTAGQNHARKRIWGEMGTGGSRGIRMSEQYVRQGGAVARTMLVEAAAQLWKVPASEISVSKGVVTHAVTKRTTTYGKLASSAALLPVPDLKSMKLKDPKDWTIAGKPLKRLDTADKLNGSKVYAIDLKLPGMLVAAIKACPVFGGTLAKFDATAISTMPGVRHVLRVDDTAVAVVAETYWQAQKALASLPVTWMVPRPRRTRLINQRPT